ncbi:Uncharacterized protein dnm_042600 [Desulfonema magnum]|uniref:Uncharacterized protein n=1 Tax=Desulfonema magnum TaxID=45655 RepID=A0A975BN40_9BACT|nr:Uncharacterized protein dnm_042600 [Desulfonema magnum]
MSEKKTCLPSFSLKLFLPMRGYEIIGLVTVPVSSLVISPHEGL